MRFLAAVLLLFSAAALLAQQPGTDPVRTKALHPPAGARIAIVEYYDLECPQCARVAPLVREAARQYRIPLVQKDFPLPPTTHPWSFDAAVIARYFDSRSKELGEQFRVWIFQHQPEITKGNLYDKAQEFARSHGEPGMPMLLDPGKKFEGQVRADQQEGMRISIEHTPTIFIVTSSPSLPYVEVDDPLNKLFTTIDQVEKQVGSEPAPAAPKKKAAAAKSKARAH